MDAIQNAVSPIEVERQIVAEHYFTAHDGQTGAAARRTKEAGYIRPGDEVPPPFALRKVMICALTLKNSYVVIGTAQVTVLDQFDDRLCRQCARVAAVNQIPPLIRYGMLTEIAAEKEVAEC